MSQSLAPIPAFQNAWRLLSQHWGVLLFMPVEAVLGLVTLFSLQMRDEANFAFAIAIMVTSYTVLASFALAQREPRSIGDLIGDVIHRFWRVVIFILSVSLLAAFFASAVGADVLVVGSLGFVLSIGAAYVQIRLLVLPSVIAIEDEPLLESIQRSWQLTGTHHRQTLVLGIFAYLGLVALVAAFSLFASALVLGGSSGAGAWSWYFVGLALIVCGVLSCAAYLPFAIALQATAYLALTGENVAGSAGMEGSARVG